MTQDDNTLISACRCDDLAEVARLIAAGADVNARDNDGRTPLVRAAWYGHPDIVAALLKAGADVDARNNDGKTALMWAADEPTRTALLAAEAAAALAAATGTTLIAGHPPGANNPEK